MSETHIRQQYSVLLYCVNCDLSFFILTDTFFYGKIVIVLGRIRSGKTKMFRLSFCDACKQFRIYPVSEKCTNPARGFMQYGEKQKKRKNRLTNNTRYGIIGSAKIQDIALPVFMSHGTRKCGPNRVY